MLVCNTCERSEDEVKIAKKDGICKKCKDKIWRENNKEHIRQKNSEKCKKYRDKNKDSIKIYMSKYYIKNKEVLNSKNKEYVKEWYINNKEEINKRNNDYYSDNKEKIREKQHEYYINNKESLRGTRNKYHTNRLKNDSIYRLKCKIKKMINKKFKDIKSNKDKNTIEILGCSFEYLILYIESKFESWMNWENKGLYNGQFNYGWDIDHIIPISSAKNEDDIMRLNHYTNLQPLCSKVNRDIKRDTIQ